MTKPRRLGWKIYFWVLAVLFPVGLLSLAVLDMTFQPVDLIDLAVSLVGMVGLFGYAHGRAIGAQRFWAAWLPAQLLWDALVALVLIPQGLAYLVPGSEPTTALVNPQGVVPAIPLYIKLFLHWSRSPEVWKERPAV